MNQPRKPHSIPGEPDAINWREVCCKMLQLQRQLASNLLTSGIEIPIEDVFPISEDDFFNNIHARGQSYKSNAKRLTIIGELGVGKTTQLLKIADWLLDNSPNETETEFVKPLPIWISLAQVKKPLHQYLMEDWLREVAEKLDSAPSAWVKEFTQLLKDGKVCLLLDGADEMGIADPLGTLGQWLRDPLFKNVPVVISCRFNVWERVGNALSDFDSYKMLNFSYGEGRNPDQIKQFIDKWFNKSSSMLSGAEKIEASQLRAALDESGKERIKDLARNPLHLSLLCFTWQSRQRKLPDTKAELYQMFVEAFYELKKGFYPTTPAQRRNLNAALGQLALEAIKQGYKSILPHYLVNEALESLHPELFEQALTLGLLNSVGVDAQNPLKFVYAFYHPTLLEYFAACEIEDWRFFLNPVPDNVDRGNYHIFEPQWKEVFLLWLGCAEVPAEQKEELITSLIEFEDRCGDWNAIDRANKGFYEFRAYFLAAAGITEFHQYSKSEEIIKQIVKWGFGEFNIEKQQWQTYLGPFAYAAREVLPQTQRSKVITALIELIQSPSKETHRLAAKSLGKIGIGNRDAISALVELIRYSPSARSRSMAVEILGEICTGNRDAISALVELIHHSQDDYTRRETAYSLGKMDPGNRDAISALVELIRHSPSEHTRTQAAESLGKIGIGNPEAIRALIELTRYSASQETRSRVAESLGKIALGNPDAISALIELVRHSKSTQICSWGAYALGQIGIGNPEAISALVGLTRKCKNDYARSRATSALGQMGTGNPIAISALVELIRHSPSEHTRTQAAESLGTIDPGNPEAISALVELIGNCQDEDTRYRAAESLGTIDPGNPNVISALVELTRNYQDEDTAIDAAESLGRIGIGNPDAISALVELIRNCQDAGTLFFAAHSLGKIGTGNPEAISALVELTRNVYTHSIAAYGLGKISTDTPDVISALVELISYQDGDTSYRAAESLKQIGTDNPNVISALVELTRNPQSEYTCRRAAETLGKIDPGNCDAISALVELTRNPQDENTDRRAAEILGKIGTGNPEAISALVELTRNSPDESICYSAAASLEMILATEKQMAGVVTALKDFLSNETYENDFKRFRNCYGVILHCVQILPYPDFYQAWHRQPPTPAEM